ncbi:PREDICTED: protamine-like [Cyphomyrmex costatus]|uniref:protamine-like n=1 Tax=Cyphomyrmex costatus TaxID=456900 RepID=UPI0008522009|nr:PREDICTED: protamine-like [Cyphomyrmex costatus]XP_018405019.1 PREDICTED: protamine-like [Cyphomyrmex costatus]
MMDPNNYERKSDDRGVFEETDKTMSEQKKETDTEKRLARCARRAERKAICRCGQRSRTRTRSRSRRRKRRIVSQNPFIIFYLEMYYKMPDKHVTEVARQAGKEWCALPQEERMKYIRLAEREQKRRKSGRGRRRIRRRRRRRGRDSD